MKMKTTKLIFATVLLSTVFVACRKEITEPTNANAESTTSESATTATLKTIGSNGTVRYSKTEAAAILNKYRAMSFDNLSRVFSTNGKLFTYDEIAGKTSGAFVKMDPTYVKVMSTDFLTKFIDQNSRWMGKNFHTKFDNKNKGAGINLFDNLLIKEAFTFKTYNINSIPFDGKPCLYLDYSGTIMSSITDYLRKVEDGVFLGQVYTKTPGTNKLRLMGYFTLVALEKTSQ